MTSKFKSAGGVYYTTSLFWEPWKAQFTDRDKLQEPPYTLYEDVEGKINAGRVFVSLGDPTGYLFTQELLDGSYKHWQKLEGIKWFKEALELWREELKIKQVAESIQKIREIASGESAQAINAAKYIAERGWESKSTRGRPSKEELSGELKRQVEMSEKHQADLERIGGLKLINGGKNK